MMKQMDTLFDVIFVIEGTAACGVYINEIKSNYLIPAVEFFSAGGMEDIFSSANKSSSSLFGIVCFRTSQSLPSCSTYGPFSPQKFLKTAVENLDLSGGKSECNANLAEGLATALVCFSDLDKLRGKDRQEVTTSKHCILITSSSPYSMPVSECFEYEGKNVEQLSSIFNEKNINLSIISPRKIPILFEIFEKSGGGDVTTLTSKNYSKDPRHLVLLKGWVLKERAASPNQQPAPTTQLPVAQQNAPPPQQQAPVQIMQASDNSMGMSNNNPAMRPNPPRQNTPIMAGQNNPQQQNMPGQMIGNPQFVGNPQRPSNPQQQAQRWIAPNQTRPPFINQGGMVQNNMMQQQQQQQSQPNQPNQQNSALISQLTQPPNTGMTAQQITMARMAALQNQQQNQNQIMQGNQSNPNMNMIGPNTMQNNPQIIGGQQQQQQVAQQNSQQGQQMNPQQQGIVPPLNRERIWRGTLEWNDKQNQQNTTRQVQCEIYATVSKETNEVEVRGDSWPQRLIMQLMPRGVITNVGGHLLRDAKIVNFQWGQPSDSFESLSKVMSNGFAGCVHFTPAQCDVKILILLYMADKKSYYGFIPNDQNNYVDRLRRVIQQSKITQFGQNPQQQQQQQQGIPRMGLNPNNPMGINSPIVGNQNPMNSQQNIGTMQQDQNMMQFNQMQQQMQGGPNMVVGNPNQQRMTRPNLMPNNLRHLLQQQQNQFRPQMGVPQQQQQQQPNQQMHGSMDQDYMF